MDVLSIYFYLSTSIAMGSMTMEETYPYQDDGFILFKVPLI